MATSKSWAGTGWLTSDRGGYIKVVGRDRLAYIEDTGGYIKVVGTDRLA